MPKLNIHSDGQFPPANANYNWHWRAGLEKLSIRLANLLLISFLIGLLLTGSNQNADQAAALTKTPKPFKVKLIIQKNTRSKKSYSVKASTKNTVFDVLKTASKKNKFSLKYSNYSFGVFIEEIDKVRNNPAKSKYWLYYINGKLANLGASSQRVKKGDKILWKYKKTQ